MSDRMFDVTALPDANRQRRARQRNGLRYGPAHNDRRCTPTILFRQLDDEFHFEIDVAADPETAKCARYYTAEDDGLAQDWAPWRCWMNPPYSQLEYWTRKAAREAKEGALVVGLLPVRTDLEWFHRDVLAEDAEVRFILGRVRFTRPYMPSWRGSAPHPSMIVVWSDA